MMQLKCEDYYDATYICKIGHFGAKYGYYVIFELAKHTKSFGVNHAKVILELSKVIMSFWS